MDTHSFTPTRRTCEITREQHDDTQDNQAQTNPCQSIYPAIVSGASSGSGRAIANTFAQQGVAVVYADITEGGYEHKIEFTTHDLIQGNDGRAVFVECDVTDRE